MTKKDEIKALRDLLIKLEYLIGSSCYNGNIQNYDSWGVANAPGRHFRYPVTFDTNKGKMKRKHVEKDIDPDVLMRGYYAFGANNLQIYDGLYQVIKYLIANYGLQVDLHPADDPDNRPWNQWHELLDKFDPETDTCPKCEHKYSCRIKLRSGTAIYYLCSSCTTLFGVKRHSQS